MTKEDAQNLDTKYLLYEYFIVKGRGKDESKINLKFKKASQAFLCFDNNLSHEASLIGVPYIGKRKTLMQK